MSNQFMIPSFSSISDVGCIAMLLIAGNYTGYIWNDEKYTTNVIGNYVSTGSYTNISDNVKTGTYFTFNKNCDCRIYYNIYGNETYYFPFFLYRNNDKIVVNQASRDVAQEIHGYTDITFNNGDNIAINSGGAHLFGAGLVFLLN